MVKIFLIFLLQTVLVYSLGKNLSPDESLKEDMLLDPVEFANKYGKKAEKYNIITADGYILELHRVLSDDGKPLRKHPVFLMHGLASSSFDWLPLGPGKSLLFLLSDEGFDVWMGNARGNRYSRRHLRRKPNSMQFWKFTWHEMGIYDLPASIDYILNATNSQSLHYIGHSQGTTSFFVMTSMRPEYNKKIQSMNALSPVAFMSRMESKSANLKHYTDWFMASNIIFGVEEIPHLPLGSFGYEMCNKKSPVSELCDNIYFLVGGFNSLLFNKTLIPVLVSHVPAGFSIRQVIHFGQEAVSGRFRQFDFGIENIGVYGDTEPPDYPLDKITAPVALHWSDGDSLAHPKDVEQLSKRLCNVKVNRRVPYKQFNHLDFLCATQAKKYLYDSVISIILSSDEALAETGNCKY